MTYFAHRVQLEKYLGSNHKFESIEFGEHAETREEAIEAVERDIASYISMMEKKHTTKNKINQEPFKLK